MVYLWESSSYQTLCRCQTNINNTFKQNLFYEITFDSNIKLLWIFKKYQYSQIYLSEKLMIWNSKNTEYRTLKYLGIYGFQLKSYKRNYKSLTVAELKF